MVKAVAALIEFCYLVRRSIIDEDTLVQIDAALAQFHEHREVFREDIRPEGFSLPRQHSLVHYHFMITQYGAPNGLCSSITESKHIKAVKKPYRRSSRNKPLGQILVSNQRNDKLAAARVNFQARGMLTGPNLSGFIGELCAPETNATPNPLALLAVNVAQAPSDLVDDALSREVNETGAVEEPLAEAEVKLAKTYGALCYVYLCFTL